MVERARRIGLILPSSNTSVEPDFHRVLPPGASLHAARVWLVDTTLESLETMNQDAEHAAQSLASAGVNVIAYACTSGSFLGGPGYDQQLLERVRVAAGGTDAIGTTPAVISALHAVEAKSVAVVTPYIDSINTRLTDFLDASGFQVASMAGQQLIANLDIGDQTPEEIIDFARKNLAQEADAYFLSCTNWRAMETAEALEQESGKPVLTSNQATIWATLQKLNYRDPIQGYGRLLRTPTASTIGG